MVITHLPTASCPTWALAAGDLGANGLSDTENIDKRRAGEEDEKRNILDNSPPLRTLTSSLLLFFLRSFEKEEAIIAEAARLLENPDRNRTNLFRVSRCNCFF